MEIRTEHGLILIQEKCYNFLAAIVLMGICKLPSIDLYLSTKPLYHGNWMRALIPSRTRFKALLTFFKVVEQIKLILEPVSAKESLTV